MSTALRAACRQQFFLVKGQPITRDTICSLNDRLMHLVGTYDYAPGTYRLHLVPVLGGGLDAVMLGDGTVESFPL